MSRDSEAPRDEPQPMTPELLALLHAMNAVYAQPIATLAEAIDEAITDEVRLAQDRQFLRKRILPLVAALDVRVQRLEAENAALWDVLNEDGWDCSADPGHEHLAAKLEALRVKRLTL